jgi:hypothetical protein
MKNFNQYISEDLTRALIEPQSSASEQAKALGLAYVGFGRYEDPNTQQITHVVQNDRLIPYKKVVKTNTYKKAGSDDYGNLMNDVKGEIEQLHNDLINYYTPESYDDNELSAIEAYTGEEYIDINDKLYSLPTGIPADQIEPEYSDDELPATIASLDSALNKVKVDRDFVVYINLGSGYKLEDMKAGSVYRFKGYRSTSLNPGIAINFGSSSKGQSRRQQTILLQVVIKKGSKGMYVDDFSSVPGEGEFLLPRGSSIKITGGPSKLVGSNAYSGQMNHQVMLFSADLIKNK